MIPLLFDGSLDQMILSEWIQALARGDAEEARSGSMAPAVKRAADGLAMSSRNAYLTAAERTAAASLSRSLCKAERLVRRGESSAAAIVSLVTQELRGEPLVAVEYVKLCDAENLHDVDEIHSRAVLALAVRIGKARLIDNRVLEPRKRGGR